MNLMFGGKNKNESLTWLKIVFSVFWEPKTDFVDIPPPLIRYWSIDGNSLVFFGNMTRKIKLKKAMISSLIFMKYCNYVFRKNHIPNFNFLVQLGVGGRYARKKL